MSDTDQLDIDPESKALQFQILESNGRWVLEPAYPQFPRTPDEAAAIMEARTVMPTDPQDRIAIPAATRERLDVEPGDVVSLATIGGAWAAAFCATMLDAFEPLMQALADTANSVMNALSGVLEAGTEDDDRGPRLPDHIREARARRENQRKRHERGLGDDRYGGKHD